MNGRGRKCAHLACTAYPVRRGVCLDHWRALVGRGGVVLPTPEEDAEL